jgi:hypothetical protein
MTKTKEQGSQEMCSQRKLQSENEWLGKYSTGEPQPMPSPCC